MKAFAITAAAILMTASCASAAVQTREVAYQRGDQKFVGYLASDDSIEGKRPGVLVVHEWWGLNDYARKRADELAELGYVAFAVDMYGDGKTADHPKQAGEFASAVGGNPPLMKARFDAARRMLAKHQTVDPKHLAAIGYCFGGSVALEMARQGADLAAVASFHGALATKNPAQAGKTKAKVLVMTGGDDAMIKPESVEAFEKEMKAAKVDYKVVVYPGAKHSFTNPTADENAKKFDLPMAYDPQADSASWKELKEFLARAFGR